MYIFHKNYLTGYYTVTDGAKQFVTVNAKEAALLCDELNELERRTTQ